MAGRGRQIPPQKGEGMKAKYIGKCRDKNGYAVHLFYEYRGREYMITDEHNGYSETTAEKHRCEQKRIDALLEPEKEPQGKAFEFSDLDCLYE